MKTIIKLLMILVLIGVIAYGGMCVYGNYFAPGTAIGDDIPSKSEASHSLVVRNTATVILTDDYEVFGEEVGSRTFYLHGYWEMVGRDFRYVDDTLVMSEQVFGQIDLKRRK